MKFLNPLIAVTDLERSKKFYQDVFGLEVIQDFGANVTLTGGICLQTAETWKTFIDASNDDLLFGGMTVELYFEEDNFDAFIERLDAMEDIRYVHPVKEHAWGQRAVRLYDPDLHILEVGENMKAVCRRFLDAGMTIEEAAERMDVSCGYIRDCIK